MNTDYFDNIVLVLYLIVLGLGIVQHIANIGLAIKHWRELRPYWVHGLLVALIFVLQTQMAEFGYGLRHFSNWKNLFVLLALLNPMVLYLAVAIIFPDVKQQSTEQSAINLKQHYFDSRIPLYLTLGLLPLSNLLTISVFFGDWSLNPYKGFMILFSLLLVSLAIIKSELYHKIVITLILIVFVLFSVLFSSNFAASP